MTTETMSVHKGLSEMRILESRIAIAASELSCCIAKKHSSEKVNGIALDEYKKQMQGSYDKIVDLIARCEAIKRAITLSNAKTQVKIVDKDYTVAEAIWMRNHGIDYKKTLVAAMKKQLALAQKTISAENGEKLETRADNMVINTYGQKESKTNSAEIEKFRKDFIESQTYELVTISGLNEKIETFEKEIADFLAEVDAALSVSNAITEITIEY